MSPTLHDLAQATPSTRDRYVDFLRAASWPDSGGHMPCPFETTALALFGTTALAFAEGRRRLDWEESRLQGIVMERLIAQDLMVLWSDDLAGPWTSVLWPSSMARGCSTLRVAFRSRRCVRRSDDA